MTRDYHNDLNSDYWNGRLWWSRRHRKTLFGFFLFAVAFGGGLNVWALLSTDRRVDMFAWAAGVLSIVWCISLALAIRRSYHADVQIRQEMVEQVYTFGKLL